MRVGRLAFIDGVDHGQVVHAETGERVGEHGTQFADALRDLGLTALQVGDALLHAVQFLLRGLATLVDLLVGVFGGLLEDACRVRVRLVTLAGSVRLSLVTGLLRGGNQLAGLLVGGLATLVQVGEQLIDLLRGLLLLGGDVGADLLHFGVDLADGLGAVHLRLVGDLLGLRLGGVGDFGGTALRVGHHLGHLLAHVRQLLVGFGKRGFDLVVGLALQAGDLLIGVLALFGDLAGRLGAHVGNLTFLRGAFGGKTLAVFLTGVGQFQIDGLTLRHHGLLGLAAHLVDLMLGIGPHGFGFVLGVTEHLGRLGVGVVHDALGVDFGVVQQCFSLQLHRGAGRGSVLLGSFKQLGAGLFRAGEHLLGVGAQ